MIIIDIVKGIIKAILFIPIYFIDSLLNLGANNYTSYNLFHDFLNW